MSAPRVKTRHSGIYKRGGSYVYVYRDRDGRQRSGSARTLDDAIKARRSLTARVDRGEDVIPKRVTFAEYAREWIETYDGIRPKARNDYRVVIEKRLIPQLGDVELSRLRKSHVKSFLVWLCDDEAQGRHLKDATIRKIIVPLSSCLRTAVEDEVGGILANPVTGVRLPRRDKAHEISTGTDTRGAQDHARARVLTEEQVADLIAAMPERHRDLIRLLDVTGLRISEALALGWGDLQLDGDPRVFVNRMVTDNPDRKPGQPWWIFQPPKSAASVREVPIPESLAADLQRRRVELIADGTPAGEEDLAFPTRTGAPIDQHNLRRDFRKAAKAAGAGWAGFHALRHTCASRLFAARRDAKEIAKWLGHSDAGFTLRTYVHLMPDHELIALPESAPQGGSNVATTDRLGGVPTTTATLQKAA